MWSGQVVTLKWQERTQWNKEEKENNENADIKQGGKQGRAENMEADNNTKTIKK